MAKYLGETGLVYLWSKIKAWVGNYTKITTSNGVNTLTVGNTSTTILEKITSTDKLSADLIQDGTNNKAYTATEKTKLSGIESGAEVNQNAFSNVKVGSSTIAADGKTDTLELAVASNSVASLTADTTNDKVTIDVDKDLSKYDNTTSGFITASDVPEGAAASSVTPVMNGTAAKGTDDGFARGDHVHPSDTSKINTSAIGAANGVCPLDSNAKIDSSYLPSYVDDVVEAYIKTGETALGSTFLASGSATGSAITPESGKIYVILNSSNDYPTYTQFRWGGSAYVKLNDGGISELSTSEMDTATNNWT